MTSRSLAGRAVALVCLATLATSAEAQSTRDRNARSAEDYELAIVCRGALSALAVGDAKAAGLSPSAGLLMFDTSKTTKTRVGGELLVAGVADDYRPSLDIPAFPVRFDCVVNLATRQVTSVTYDAIDGGGNPVEKRPVQIVREGRYLEACRTEIDRKVVDEATKRGVAAEGSNAEPNPATATVATKGNTVEIRGDGRVRLSRDYLWEPMTFGCRYDVKKGKVNSAWYSIEGSYQLGALSSERVDALTDCHYAVRGAVVDDARKRGYDYWRRTEVHLENRANFTEKGRQLEVAGQGWFLAAREHRERTPITFTCMYDPARREVVAAAFEAKETARTPTGEIANGRTGTLVCESWNGLHKTCAAGIRGDVRIIKQMSKTPCEAYKNWIYSTSGITVWGDCRAEFEFDAR